MNKQTAMRTLLAQLKEERTNLPLPIEWDRCYQAIEMTIEHTYLEMEQDQMEVSDEEIVKASYDQATFTPSFIRGAQWYREQIKNKM